MTDDYEEIEQEEPAQLASGDQLPRFLIPECCREGWDDCPHTVRKPDPVRRNIAL